MKGSEFNPQFKKQTTTIKKTKTFSSKLKLRESITTRPTAS
jgi:hypothetical protein